MKLLKKIKNMKPMDFILIGAIIITVGGLIAAVATYFHNKQSSLKSTKTLDGVKRAEQELADLKNKNQKLNNQVTDLFKTIDDLRRENTDLYGKLQESNTETYNTLTGGDSRPILAIDIFLDMIDNKFSTEYRSVIFKLINKNKYPIKAINFMIKDPFSKIITDGKEIDINEVNLTKRIETLSSYDHYFEIHRSHFPKAQGSFTYFIEIRWQNGILLYFIDMAIDPQSHKLKINDIRIDPHSEDFNPFDYVDILPENVGPKLSKFKNPWNQNK